MIRSILFFVCQVAFVFVCSSFSPIHAVDCKIKLRTLDGVWHEYQHGEFIIQYTLEGEHALQNPDDTTLSGIPDVVADLATQLDVMRDMLLKLDFQLPLESPRYKSQDARSIVVRFQNLPRGNGIAYDEVHKTRAGECVLLISIGKHYRSGGLTPAHELFHLVQYGYTMFKRPWFHEATARWAETILGKTSVAARPIPDNEADRKAFWAQSYSAVSVWYGLIKRCNQNHIRVAVPDHLSALRYRNGHPVILDEDIPGHEFIRQVLEQLGRLSDLITQKEGLRPHRWSEKVQRDPRYDAEMWSLVLQAGRC